MGRRSWGRRLGRCAVASTVALAVVSVVNATTGSPALAQTPTPLTCRSTSSLGNFGSSVTSQVDVSGAPSESLRSGTFTVSYADPGQTVPTTDQGYPVTAESAIRLVIPLPVQAAFVSATLSGGSNVGAGATVAQQADPSSPSGLDLVETVPGPIGSGQSYALPTVNLTLTASGPVGASIVTDLLDVQPVGPAPASADPALTSHLAVTGPSGSVDITTGCWPTSPTPTTLSSTAIVAIDTIPPAISLTVPADGAVYTLGQSVDAAYTCTDVASYGLATCAGTVADGHPVDTSSVGIHIFTVTATDTRGTPAERKVSYDVRSALSPTVTGPADDGSLTSTPPQCAFGNPACSLPLGPAVTYQVTSPVPVGGTLVRGDTFAVEWQVYEPGSWSASPRAGPTSLTWTLPAPAGAVIDGPVTTGASGLGSPADGTGGLNGAGACTDPSCTGHTPVPGVVSVNGTSESGTGWTYPATAASSLVVGWNDDSGSSAGTDGAYLDLRYTVKVLTPGTVTLPGFPTLTGVPASGGVLTTTAVPPPAPPVSFTVVDPLPPSVTLTAPTDGAGYHFGQVLDSAYTCSDPVVAVVSCVGTIADGARLDTTSLTPESIHTFQVVADDAVGNTETLFVAYVVLVPPPTVAPTTASVAWASSGTIPVLSVDTSTYPIVPTSVTIVTPPSFGTATANVDGTVHYSNDGALSLTDSFTYTVADTLGDVSGPATVVIAVVPPLESTPLSPALTLAQGTASPVDTLSGTVVSGGACIGSAPRLVGQPVAACGSLAPLVVNNDSGSTAGWTLTGELTDFLDPAVAPGTTCDSPAHFTPQCIPGGDLGWTPTASVVTALPGTAAQIAPGSVVTPPTAVVGGAATSPPPGIHDTPQVLCQAQAGVSEGAFQCGGSLVVTVPASTTDPLPPGFEATLTLTLSYS